MAEQKKEELLSKEDLRQWLEQGTKDLPKEKVSVPEIKPGAFVWVRAATAAEHAEYQNRLNKVQVDDEGKVTSTDIASNYKTVLVAKCTIDKDGGRVFTDDDVAMLSLKMAGVVDRLFGKILILSGMGRGAYKETVKNSGAGTAP